MQFAFALCTRGFFVIRDIKVILCNSTFSKKRVDVNKRTSRHSSYNLVCPRYNRETEGEKTFQVSTIKLWNSPPNDIKKENTIENFELKFKTHFKVT